MLPQVIVLVAGGRFVSLAVERLGMDRAAWMSAISVVVGLAVFALFSSFGYVFIALALVLVAAGIRVNGVVAGTNVLRGLPKNRTSIGAALVDTSSEVATAVGIAVPGTILAAVFSGSIATAHWTSPQTAEFERAILIAGMALTVAAGALVAWGVARMRRADGRSVGGENSGALGGPSSLQSRTLGSS
jgi:hypothetical protein